MNPIIGRELITRWRTLKSFALVLAYAAPLAVGVVLAYYGSVSWEDAVYSGVATQPGFTTISLTTGRALFSTLAWMQIVGWILFAPTLTSTTIASEREKGLLESLQLSCLTRRQIVGGKLISAILFVLLVMLAALPVISICFMLGGVSPADFIEVALLSLSTATMCACLGMAYSAWGHRGTAAMRSTYIAIVLWILSSCLPMAFRGFESITFLLNPIAAVLLISDPTLGSGMSGGSSTMFMVAQPPWLICLVIETFASVAFLWAASRGLRRPLVQQQWIGLTSEVPVDKAPLSKTAAKSARFELGSISRFSFDNPILARELRGKFRMRRPSRAVLVVEVILGLIVSYFYLKLLSATLFDPKSRASTWWLISYIGLLVITVAAPIMGAGAFTRERETGTWTGIKLSSLSATDIVSGKLSAILLTCLIFTIPTWPLLAAALIPTANSENFIGAPPSLFQIIWGLVLMACTAWSLGICGMFVSRYCRRTAAAVGWTLALTFGLLIVMPGLMASNSSGFEWEICWTFNPIGALSFLSDYHRFTSDQQHLGFAYPIEYLTGLGLLVLASLLFLVGRDLRSED